jgi:hypothetical protein
MFVRVTAHTPGLAVLLGVAALALAAPAARAQQRLAIPPGYCPPPANQPCPPAIPPATTAPTQPAQPTQPTTPSQPAQPQTPAPAEQTSPAPDQGAAPSLPTEQAAAAGGESFASATPNMIGDLLAGASIRRTVRFPNGATVNAVLPVQARSGFKIGENESPRPQDRVFFTYNYFNNVNKALNPIDFPRVDAHREMIGFEKTFDNKNASIGMRLPYLMIDSNGGVKDRDFGDLSVILKYAFINDPCGNVVSCGLVATFPTGGSSADAFNAFGDVVHTTILQPWAGFIYACDDFFVQGFSSAAIPVDDRDVAFWFNDLGVGWFCYRAADPHNRPGNAFNDCVPGGSAPDPTLNAFVPTCCGDCCCGTHFLTALIPTVEVHATTPLNHRGFSVTDPVEGFDQVVITAGVHMVFLNRATLLLGAATPITGPKPFDVEAAAYFNLRF